MHLRTNPRTLVVSAACLVSALLLPPAAAAQVSFRATAVSHIETRPDIARVEFATGDVALFALDGPLVTHIEVHVSGRRYPVSLECAGLQNVRVEAADIRH